MTVVEDTAPTESSERKPTAVEVAIIGAGFAGLGTGVHLKREGIDDFVILERTDNVGGTWWVNTYPGCQCDVPSHLYSFSFFQNPDWGRTYSKQAEIRDYLLRCAEKFGLYPHVRLNNEVTAAAWDDAEGRWMVETDRGERYAARVLVGAMGALSTPKYPDLPGLDSFEGKVMHSAEWDHGHDLTGERVASIGTGASAIQYVPAIQPKVAKLHVFQRTPPWVMPHSDRPTTRWERRLYRAFPPLQRLVRGGIYASRELLVLGFAKRPRLMKIVERIARRHMERQIPDPELRRKVTPDYTIGCKRILPTDNWYPALTKPNVELVTDAITEIRPHAVVTADGTEREVDTIVFGTGFTVTEMPIMEWLRGRDGSTLKEHWKGSMQAHLGTAIDGFPNFFMLAGPNTGLGHSSMVYMIESQIEHVMGALKELRARGADTVEVRRDVLERYNEDLQRKLEGTVWNTGCSSWYLDDTGRNPTLWPDWTFKFRRRVREFDPAEYQVAAAGQAEREAVAA